MTCGCQRATVSDPLTANLAGADEDSRMEFWHTLSQRSTPSNDDAFHALLLFFNNNDPASDFAGRVQTLQELGWLAKDFDEPADLAVTRGTVARILVIALEIDGGLTMHIFGPAERYAVRELFHEGIFPRSSPHQTFSGGTFVALIGRVEDYQRTRALDRVEN